MSQILCQNLSFSYSRSLSPVFDHVNLQFDSTWKIGLVGRNGRGKTTLCSIFTGKLPYQGSIETNQTFISFPFEIKDEQQSMHSWIQTAYPELETWKLERELQLLGVDSRIVERSIATYSLGEKTKMQLAMLFALDGVFPLLDEPTNHLDQMGKQILIAYLQQKSGFLLVSHDREVLDQVCNHIIALNRHCIDVVSGNFSSWYAGKLERDAFEQHQNHSLKKHIHKMEASAKQKATWSDRLEATKIGSHVADRGFVGAQVARMMKRSKQIERRRNQAIAQQKGLLKEVDHIEPLTLIPLKHHKKRLLALEDVVVMRTKALHQPISFELLEHERILLRGVNGAGKTSVMEAIQGKLAYSGTIELANGVILAYLPQTTTHLEGNLIAYLKRYTNDVTGCLTRLKKLDFERSDFDVDLATLSEGQRKKVAIAIALGEQAHLYVWDEPMNYLDVITRMQVEEAILQSRATMVFVSHDTTTQAKLATKEVTLVLP